MNKHRGISLIGLLITSGVLVFFALMGFKLMPSYLEYFTVKRVVADIANSPEVRGGSLHDVQAAFARRAQIDNITSVTANELEVTKTGEGFEIAVSWAARVPLFGNLNACIDFEVKSK
jgi:hypothetical protein